MLEEIWIMGLQIFVSVSDFLVELKKLIVELWKDIVELTKNSFLKLAQDIAPHLSKLIIEAHVQLDNVASPLRSAAKKAWNKLRKFLLQQIIDIFQLEDGQWVYRTISLLLLPKETEVRRIIQDTYVPFEDLPLDVRRQLIRNGRIRELDFTRTRDAEFDRLNDLTA